MRPTMNEKTAEMRRRKKTKWSKTNNSNKKDKVNNAGKSKDITRQRYCILTAKTMPMIMTTLVGLHHTVVN